VGAALGWRYSMEARVVGSMRMRVQRPSAGLVEGPVAAVVEPITHGQPGLGLVARRGLRTTDPAFRVFR